MTNWVLTKPCKTVTYKQSHTGLVMKHILLFTLLLTFGLSQHYLKTIDPNNQRQSIQKLHTSADVTVSDGRTYTAKSLFIDKQRAIFRRIYPDRTETEGVDGLYTWQFDGENEVEANEIIKSMTLGHQFHAILMNNELGIMSNEERIFGHLEKEASKDNHQIPNSDVRPSTSVLKDLGIKTNQKIKTHAFKFDDVERYIVIGMDDLPIGMAFHPAPEVTISFKFEHWKMTNGINLPWRIIINDGHRTYTFNYTFIEFNSGEMNDYRPPMEKQTAKQQIHRLHRQIMDDHLFERATTQFQTKGDSVYVLSGGQMYRSSGQQNAERFKMMMGNRDYHIYDDLMKPVVHVSDDGTLGWAMVRIYAKGVRLNPDRSISGPLEFTYAWVELYQKVEGRWTMVGNVSNTGE
jgi:hypothetical protein